MATGQTAAGQELLDQYRPTPHASLSPFAVQRAQSTRFTLQQLPQYLVYLIELLCQAFSQMF